MDTFLFMKILTEKDIRTSKFVFFTFQITFQAIKKLYFESSTAKELTQKTPIVCISVSVYAVFKYRYRKSFSFTYYM